MKGSPHLVLHNTGSDCMANTKQSPRPQSEAEVSEAEVKFREKADGIAERALSPGKMKMKKALMPPMTLMTLLMSGRNMAMTSVAMSHSTVSA